MKIKSPFLGYKIGLVILGLFVIGLVVFVVVQANTTKQDVDLTKMAQSIADSLNKYVTKNNAVPQSLSAAYKKDIPSAITYKKLPGSTDAMEYKFCINYKTATDSSIGDKVEKLRAGMDQFNGLADDVTFIGSDLAIPDTHHKGKNCQTIWVSVATSQSSQVDTTQYVAPYRECGLDYVDAWSAVPVTSLTPPSAGGTGSVAVGTYPPETYTLDAKAKAFDANCQQTAFSNIHAGDFITLFFNADKSAVTAISEP